MPGPVGMDKSVSFSDDAVIKPLHVVLDLIIPSHVSILPVVNGVTVAIDVCKICKHVTGYLRQSRHTGCSCV